MPGINFILSDCINLFYKEEKNLPNVMNSCIPDCRGVGDLGDQIANTVLLQMRKYLGIKFKWLIAEM